MKTTKNRLFDELEGKQLSTEALKTIVGATAHNCTAGDCPPTGPAVDTGGR